MVERTGLAFKQCWNLVTRYGCYHTVPAWGKEGSSSSSKHPDSCTFAGSVKVQLLLEVIVRHGLDLSFHTEPLACYQSSGELTASELTQACLHWIKAVQTACFPVELDALQKNVDIPRGLQISQFCPFLEDGLIHPWGRLQFADFSDSLCHPPVHQAQVGDFVHLLIWQTHIRLHHMGVQIILSELREEFWILHARQAIKTILNKCLQCKIVKRPCRQQIEAPLPADQIRP